MPRVLEEVEADEVGAEEGAEELDADRKHAEDLGGGEHREEREADQDLRVLAHCVVRHEHHLVVKDPDAVSSSVRPALGDRGESGVGEHLVDLLVLVPVVPLPARVAALLGELDDVVEERGEDALAEHIKYPEGQLDVEEDRVASELAHEALLQGSLLCLGDLEPDPANILEAALGVAELGRRLPVVPLDIELALSLARDREREHRCNNHDAVVAHHVPFR
mmetsp:Transcript_58452/g.137244  ORF Transcript_58452/g.137244 Transcript_58452/m.137244 type:complete len:221 (+) Transcript_58452:2326-2988(+)